MSRKALLIILIILVVGFFTTILLQLLAQTTEIFSLKVKEFLMSGIFDIIKDGILISSIVLTILWNCLVRSYNKRHEKKEANDQNN